MNLCKRACLYSIRKKGKTLTLLIFLLVMATLMLTCLSIQSATETANANIKKALLGYFTINAKTLENGIPEDTVSQILDVDGLSGRYTLRSYTYDASLIVHEDFFNEDGEALKTERYGFYSYGSYNSEYNAMFLSGRFELVEGSHITEDMENGLIISRDLADWNGLEIGDTLTGIYYPESNTPAVDMEIVGIFDIVADKDDAVNLYDNASYFDYSNYTFCSMEAAEGLLEGWGSDGISEAYFYVSDAAQLDSVIEEVKKISSINWNNFNITTNDEVYQNISSALSDTGTLITTLIIVITAVSMVLIILILSMSIRSRKRETGILLAVGIAKPAVILQYVLETLLIAVVAFPLAYLSSKQVAGALGTLFGKAAENVIVTPEHFMLVAIVGGVLLVAAVLVSSISTMRLKPKQILAQME